MLQLAQFIARYGVVMGKAMWEASKKGIALFKKPTISDKKRKVLDKQRKEYEADEKAGIKAGNKMSDADYMKKFKAQNKEAVSNMKEAASKGRAKKSVQSYRKEVDKDTKWSPSRGISPNDPGVHNTPETLRKHLMNAPAAATALAGTTASLVHKNNSKKKGK